MFHAGKTTQLRILGLDTGFSSFGYAVLTCGLTYDLLDLGVIRTEKNTNKQEVFAASDNVQRIAIIVRHLSSVLDKTRPHLIAIERESWPRNAAISAKLGMAFGVVYTFKVLGEVPMVMISPQALKLFMTGAKSATKLDIGQAVERLLPGTEREITRRIRATGQHEHVYDAIALALTATKTDLFQALKGDLK